MSDIGDIDPSVNRQIFIRTYIYAANYKLCNECKSVKEQQIFIKIAILCKIVHTRKQFCYSVADFSLYHILK